MAEAKILTGAGKRRFFYGYVVLGATFFVLMVSWGTFYSFGVFFTPVLTEFGWTRAATSGAYSLSLLLLGVMGMVMGRLNDRFGPRVIAMVCGLMVGLGFLLMSRVDAIWQLYLFYGVIIATGMSTTFVPLLSTVARWFVKKRSLMTGVAVSGVGMGTIVVPILARWLISSYGWRWSYTIMGIAVMISVILAAQLLRRDPGQVGLAPDGLRVIEDHSSDLESRGISVREAIRTRRFWIIAFVFFCSTFVTQTILMHIVPHAGGLGLSPISAAGILSIIGGLSIGGRIGLGTLADRIGNWLTFVFCFLIALGGFILLLAGEREIWALYMFAVVFGFTYGGFMALPSPIVADLLGLKAHGALFGASNFLATVGGAVGTLIAGRIFDLNGTYRLAFLICACLCVAGLVLLSVMKARRSVR